MLENYLQQVKTCYEARTKGRGCFNNHFVELKKIIKKREVVIYIPSILGPHPYKKTMNGAKTGKMAHKHLQQVTNCFQAGPKMKVM